MTAGTGFPTVRAAAGIPNKRPRNRAAAGKWRRTKDCWPCAATNERSHHLVPAAPSRALVLRVAPQRPARRVAGREALASRLADQAVAGRHRLSAGQVLAADAAFIVDVVDPVIDGVEDG